jgi:hypothetical protein
LPVGAAAARFAKGWIVAKFEGFVRGQNRERTDICAGGAQAVKILQAFFAQEIVNSFAAAAAKAFTATGQKGCSTM